MLPLTVCASCSTTMVVGRCSIRLPGAVMVVLHNFDAAGHPPPLPITLLQLMSVLHRCCHCRVQLSDYSVNTRCHISASCSGISCRRWKHPPGTAQSLWDPSGNTCSCCLFSPRISAGGNSSRSCTFCRPTCFCRPACCCRCCACLPGYGTTSGVRRRVEPSLGLRQHQP